MANILDKYGVPLPSGRNATMKQPKPKYKFRVIVYNFGTDIDEKDYIAIDVDNVDRPSLSFSVQRLNNFNSNSKYVGKHNWNPITLTVRDSVDNKAATAIARQVQKQLDFQRRISSKSAQLKSSYTFRMAIETLSGQNPDDTMTNLIHDTVVDIGEAVTNNPGLINSIDQWLKPDGFNNNGLLDKWVCFGCVISEVDWDNLDYSNSKFLTIKLTIEMANCVQYNRISEIYGAPIDTLLPDEMNDFLNVIDNMF